MSRQITDTEKGLDEDTLVGYDYQTDRFYVINKGTTTYRKGAGTLEQTGEELIKAVLDIVAPDNEVTLEDLRIYLTSPRHAQMSTHTQTHTHKEDRDRQKWTLTCTDQ